jgi:hypothetical protein
LLEDIGTKVFPYTDFPFLEYSSNESYLKITQIKKVDYDQINEKYIIFSTDTSVLIIVNERIFVDFLTRFDYNKLVDSNIEIINLEY